MANSFGKRLLLMSTAEALAEEAKAGIGNSFSTQDAMNTGVMWASLAGEKVLETSRAKPVARLTVLPLSEEDRAVLADRYLLANQQSRGAWYIPDRVTFQAGLANLPYFLRRQPSYASGLALEEKGKTATGDSADSVYYWSVLGPLFEAIYRPILLRTANPPRGGRQERSKAWASAVECYRNLGIDVERELAIFLHGGGWSKLKVDGQLAAKEALLLALDRSVGADVAARYRILQIRTLAERYYSKARRGAATMRQVLTKQLQPILSGFFGGDWLAFLRYIGELPHAEERIVTSLPVPRLYVSAADRVPTVSTQLGLPSAEIERMLASFWPGERTASPVERRTSVMKRFWESFDKVHSRQAPGMKPLWGFVEESSSVRLEGIDEETSGPAWYVPGTHLELLPLSLLADIDSLWGGVFLASHPGRTASTPTPYGLLCKTFGPALSFWHGVALTAWFVCEGPYSRTDIKGLAEYHRRDLLALESLGCPVDVKVFEELIANETKLGKPREITEQLSEHPLGIFGMTMTVSRSVGTRRTGFKSLNDIITSHRREWAGRYLDQYLKRLWKGEILGAAREFNKLYEQKGKAPSLKQFAPFAEAPTNHWFGGDVSALFAAFGEKSPVASARERLMPADVKGFMRRVFQSIGGRPTNWGDLAQTIVGNNREKQDSEWQAHGDRKKLAELAVRYVQVAESLGRTPSLKEFGGARFKAYSSALSSDLHEAWAKFDAAVQTALEQSRTEKDLSHG